MSDFSSRLDREIALIEQQLLSFCMGRGLSLVPQSVLREVAKSLVIAQRQEARKLAPNIDLAAVTQQLEEMDKLAGQLDGVVLQEIKNKIAAIRELLTRPLPNAPC